MTIKPGHENETKIKQSAVSLSALFSSKKVIRLKNG